MTKSNDTDLSTTLWSTADRLRGVMNVDDFRDYMLSLLVLRYLSDNYEMAVNEELGSTHTMIETGHRDMRLADWYANNPKEIAKLERQMRRKVHYVLKPKYLWNNIARLAYNHDSELLSTLQSSFQYIEHESFDGTLLGLFSSINLNSEKLGRTYTDRNSKLCAIIQKIAEGLADFPTDVDTFGEISEYLIGQFAANSGKMGGEFYTPKQISNILSSIVILDSIKPTVGVKKKIERVLDFACGSGSLLLNVRRNIGPDRIGKIFGQEKNLTTYNLARMNMLLHGVKEDEFELHNGDTLYNDWSILNNTRHQDVMEFDVVVANPPFNCRWEPSEALSEDPRFKNYGLAPKSSADLAFLLHGLHFLKENGVMAIVLPLGVLFRSGSEGRIRTKLLREGHIDTVIGLPSNLFYSTGIPACILILKKHKTQNNILFINATEHSLKGRRQNHLTDEHINKIIDTYRFRKEEQLYSRTVTIDEIKENDYNLAISRYINTTEIETEIDLANVNSELIALEKKIQTARDKHNSFLKKLGYPLLP